MREDVGLETSEDMIMRRVISLAALSALVTLAACNLSLGGGGGGGGTTGNVSVFDLAAGQCFNGDIEGDVSTVAGVTCSQGHEFEVFAVLQHPGGSDYPGVDEVSSYADTECTGNVFSDYVGTLYADSDYYATNLIPTESSWAGGDREIVCILYDPDNSSLTGSARGSGD